MKNIVIIGAGLSGTLLTINLIEQGGSGGPVHITLIDRNPERDLGPAYSSREEALLLNVTAGRMGAYSSAPGHFLQWVRKKGLSAGEWDFLPRLLYREYIQELYQQAMKKKAKGTAMTRIQGEVTDISIRNGKAEVFTENHAFHADQVVLALGNFPPRHLLLANRSFIQSRHYFQNPWPDQVLDSISKDETVVLIGTGQTTVDLLVRLNRIRHEGKMIAVSRHGLFPLAHSTFKEYPSFREEIMKQNSIAGILRVVRLHIKKSKELGQDANAVMDSMRPYTQELWMNLTSEEKARFLRHVFRYFEILRSRIPPESEEVVKRLQESGQLTVVRGRITDLVPQDHHLEMIYIPAGKSRPETIASPRVINCMGPETDYLKVDHPLIKNLLNKAELQPDPFHLGMNALPNGAILHSDGTAHNILYTLGFPLRGIIWETLAAPEIRAQAEQLAHRLLQKP